MLSMTHREAAIYDDACTVPTPGLLLPGKIWLSQANWQSIFFSAISLFHIQTISSTKRVKVMGTIASQLKALSQNTPQSSIIL